MDMRVVIARIDAGWTEEPASDVFRRTAARLNVRSEDFDAHTFVHGFCADPRAPVSHAEAFDPGNIWEGLLFSLGDSRSAPDALKAEARAVWDMTDDAARVSAARAIVETHLAEMAELARVREDLVFLRTDTAVCAFTRDGEIAGAFWEYFHQIGYDDTLFVMTEHRGRGVGTDLAELKAVHIGLSHWFKSEEDMTVNTLAGQRTLEACHRRVEAYDALLSPPKEEDGLDY